MLAPPSTVSPSAGAREPTRVTAEGSRARQGRQEGAGHRPAGGRRGRSALPAFSMGPWQPWGTCQGGAGFSPRGVWPPAGRGAPPSLGELWVCRVFTEDVGLQRNIVLKLRWPETMGKLFTVTEFLGVGRVCGQLSLPRAGGHGC